MSSSQTFGRRGLPDPPAYTRPPVSPPPDRDVGPLNLGWLLFSMDGRIPRLQYWLAQLGLFLVYKIVVAASRTLKDSMAVARSTHNLSPVFLGVSVVGTVLMLAVLAIALWAGFAVAVKRWHDRDKAWTWALLGFVPVVGWVWQGIECGFLDGTLGANRFGPSPKGVVGVTYADHLTDTFS